MIKRKTITGVTNAGGNISVGNGNMVILGARATGTARRMFIPFTASNVCYLKALDWNTNTYTPIVNGDVAVEITYIEI